MYSIRLFAVRHAGGFQKFYQVFERTMVALDPVFRKIGYERMERPVAAAEGAIKGLLFDCKMCGQCVLSSTGMSCPMNCPKNLRNGPCGGVRENGNCEVKPWMRCVWVEAWSGAERIDDGLERIAVVQPPVDRSIEGSSSWLRVAREKATERRIMKQSEEKSRFALARAFSRARKFEPTAAPLAAEPAAALADHSVGERSPKFHEDDTTTTEPGSDRS